MKVVNIEEKLSKINTHWDPKIVGELNNQMVKLAKLKGEFVMHHHDNEDELFLVVKGNLKIALENDVLEINEGEFVIIPKGVKHQPIAEEEVSILLFEPSTTLNTGDKITSQTKKTLDKI